MENKLNLNGSKVISSQKIVICTGTPGSGANSIWRLLQTSGIDEATIDNNVTPSNEDKDNIFSSSLSNRMSEKDWRQETLKILDTNQNQECFGWLDFNAARYLDNYKTLSDDFLFILVYTSPDIELASLINDSDYITNQSTVIDNCIRNWSETNAQALRFYNRNREKCILVNANSVLSEPHFFIQACKEELNLNMELENTINDLSIEKIFKVSNILRVLVNNQIKSFHEIISLFQELESTANIPGRNDSHDLIDKAIIEYLTLLQTKNDLTYQLEQREKQIEELKRAEKNYEENMFNIASLKKEKDDLISDNELIRLQLQQIQKELDHYFHLNLKKEFENTNSRNEYSNEGRHIISMSDNFDGMNWYPEERDEFGSFRWTGPGGEASIELPVKPEQDVYIIIEYRNTLTSQQLTGLRIEINRVQVPHTIVKHITPRYIVAQLSSLKELVSDHINLSIILPGTESPADLDKSSDDRRKLGLCVNSISVIPVRERLYLSKPSIRINRITRYWRFLLHRLRIDKFPLPYFDGIAYLEANPLAAKAVINGDAHSAWDYYLTSGINSTRFIVAISRTPSYGTYLDALKLPIDRN